MITDQVAKFIYHLILLTNILLDLVFKYKKKLILVISLEKPQFNWKVNC